MTTIAVRPTKSLDDVKADMSELYDELKNGGVDVRTAAELANITGKYLKATHLELAREYFSRGLPPALELEDARE